MNTKVKHSYTSAFPLRFYSTLQIGPQKVASPLDHNLKNLNFSKKHPRDKVFGVIPNAFSSKFSSFPVCHPAYDDHLMHRALRHAVYSAIANNNETATFTFLPRWGR